MSGHSKWSTIKHQKGAADAKRGQLFTKLSREIIVAVREGGGGTTPDSNFRLRLAVQKARDNSMPMESWPSMRNSTMNMVTCLPSSGLATAMAAIPYRMSSSQNVIARCAVGLRDGLRTRLDCRLPSGMDRALPSTLAPIQR